MASAAEIRGDYVEARTADVFTGPCFSNAEVFIYGNHAVMAWKVTDGSWKGVDLSGLCVAAAVNGTTTFSEDHPEKATAVLIVDAKASDSQRAALIDMAKTLGGTRLNQIASVTTARMSLKLEDHTMADSERCSRGPRDAAIAPCLVLGGRARADRHPSAGRAGPCLRQRGCRVSSPLPVGDGSAGVHARARLRGPGLDNRWDDPNCRSSFVGHFAR